MNCFKKNIFALLSGLSLLSLSSCHDKFLEGGSNEVSGEKSVVLTVTSDVFEPQLRSGLDELAERRINSLYVFIYKQGARPDATPVFAQHYDQNALFDKAQARKDKYNESDEQVIRAMGLLEENLELPYGNYWVFMAANVPNDYFDFKASKSGNPFASSNLNSVTLGSLNDALASLNSLTKDRDNGYLLMSAKELEEVRPETTRVDVELKRVDARIDFSIGMSAEALNRGDRFLATEYRIVNMPRMAYLFERPIVASDAGATYDATSLANGDDYYNEEWKSLDSLDNNTSRSAATFYMVENRKPFSKEITAELGDTRAQYKARAKRTKTEIEGATANPYLSNGDFVYAPKYATYLEIKGIYKQTDLPNAQSRTSDVVYRVLLGDATANVNNYDTERNYKYTYQLTVNGVDDIITEVNSNKQTGEKEPAPDNDGTLYTSNLAFQLDSHYEQRTFLLKLSDLRNGDTGGVDAVAYYISTPFQTPKIVTYTKAELEQLNSSGYKLSADQKTDTDWLRFYIHPNDEVDMQSGILYQDVPNDADLLTLEQLMYRLTRDTQTVRDYPYFYQDRAKITVFVNENYYERRPTDDPNSPVDKELWKEFVNTPDRKFMLLVPSNHSPYSPDGESAEFPSVLSLSQYSIKTVFQNDANGQVRIWGIESVDETPDRDMIYLGATEPLLKHNEFFSNGMANQWNLLSNSGTTVQTSREYYNFYYAIPYPKVWHEHVNAKSGSVALEPTTKNTFKFKHYDYAIFAPFQRNRDDNRDDVMQRSECKWFTPSPAEAILFCQMQEIFTTDLRFKNKATSIPTVLFTNRGYRSSTNASLNTNNLFFILSNTGSQTYNEDFNAWAIKIGYGYNNTPGDRVPFSHTRMIRDLGVADDGTSKGHYEDYEMGEELIRTVEYMRYEDGDDSWRTFHTDHINPKFLRSVRATDELPAHDKSSSVNRIYKNGFKAAESYAIDPKVVLEKGLSIYGPLYDTKAGRYQAVNLYKTEDSPDGLIKPFENLQIDINRGSSPCEYYWEEPDMSDAGTWRVPNMAELNMMMVNLYDWDNRERREVYVNKYGLANHFWAFGAMPANYNVASRTGMTSTYDFFSDTYKDGYSMHVEGYLRMVGVYADDSRWIDPKNTPLFVRCVKDLP